MILPNYFERYLAALRITVSLSVLKHGLKPRHLENLKKIYISEAFFHRNSYDSIDIAKLCNNLLGAVSCLYPKFSFTCSVKDNYYINKNLFTCLILSAAKTGNVNIVSSGDYILIKISGDRQSPSPFISALGGFLLKERKTAKVLVIIPAKHTSEKSTHIESEWEYLFDKFSVVNLFFGLR